MTRAIRYAATFSLLLSAAPAIAQTANTASDRLKSSCAGDYFQFCSGADPNGPEVGACFRRNARLLSPACRTAIAESRPQPVKRVRRRR